MAAVTIQGAIQTAREITCTWSTDDAIGTATAAIIFDSTATKQDVQKALNACMRAFSREALQNDDPADFRTSGATDE